MNRTEMVNARTAQLEKLDDIQLADMVLKYFEENATLPGQKAIKDFARDIKAEFDGKASTGLLSQVRKDFIEEFASLLVQEVKLKNVRVLNENKPNRGKDGTKASDLPMVLVDSVPAPINRMKDSYELPVYVTGNFVRLENGDTLGYFPDGFVKNHRSMEGIKGTVIVSDHSNGKFANMSYRMLIDLGESLAA